MQVTSLSVKPKNKVDLFVHLFNIFTSVNITEITMQKEVSKISFS